jgi:cytochrome c553
MPSIKSLISRMASAYIALLCLSASLPVQAEGNPDAGRVKAYTCTGCHGIPGYNNTYPTYKVPKIGGQNPAYLQASLAAYASGARTHATMRLQAKSIGETDIADISAWLASLASEDAGAAPDPAQAPEQTATCAACHGVDGQSADPSYPVLAGQHASYLRRALYDYRNGARKNPVMGGFAAALSDRDIEVLAAWYAGLPGLQDLSGK